LTPSKAAQPSQYPSTAVTASPIPGGITFDLLKPTVDVTTKKVTLNLTYKNVLDGNKYVNGKPLFFPNGQPQPNYVSNSWTQDFYIPTNLTPGTYNFKNQPIMINGALNGYLTATVEVAPSGAVSVTGSISNTVDKVQAGFTMGVDRDGIVYARHDQVTGTLTYTGNSDEFGSNVAPNTSGNGKSNASSGF
jgi:hypothetical protein